MLCLPVFMETKLVFKQENTLCVMHLNFLLSIFVFRFFVLCIRAIKLACSVVDGQSVMPRALRARTRLLTIESPRRLRFPSELRGDGAEGGNEDIHTLCSRKERLRLSLHDVFIFERHTYTAMLSLLFFIYFRNEFHSFNPNKILKIN